MLLMYEKIDIHLGINGIHTLFLDTFFTYVTYLGDGITTSIAVIIVGILAFKRHRYATFVLGWVTLILVGVFSQLLKRAVFPEASRPAKFIGEQLLYLVPDVEIHSANSFPSGHTTAAFAFFAFVTMVFFKNNKLMQFVMAMVAVLIGYSRMYLSQHFLEDVVTGAVLGLICYALAHWFVSMFPFGKTLN